MNITKESLEQEIANYLRMIQNYKNNPEYVNPNCSEQQARITYERLNREYYFSYGIKNRKQ